MNRIILLLLYACFIGAWTGQNVQKPLTGKYTADIRTDVLPKNLQGQWTLVFSGKDEYSVFRDTSLMVSGYYEVRGDTLILADLKGKLACPDEHSEGVYQFVKDAESVRFVRLNDICRGRSSILTAKPYRKLKTD